MEALSLVLPSYDPVELEERLGSDKRYLLYDACEVGRYDHMLGLLDALVNPNIPLSERAGQVPLHRAAINGDMYAVWILLSHNADPDLVDDYDRTPLWYAAKTNELAAMVLFPVTKNTDEEGALVPRSIKYGRFDLANVLMRTGSSIRSSKEYSSLKSALKNERKDLAALIVDDAADLEQLFCQAVRKGSIRVVIFLLDYRINLDCQEEETRLTPLHIAAKKGYLKIARLLICEGADVTTLDKNGNTPLYKALKHHHFTIADTLIDSGADVEEINENGMTLIERFWVDQEVVNFLETWGVAASSESTELDVPEFCYDDSDEGDSSTKALFEEFRKESSTEYESSTEGDTITEWSDGCASSYSEDTEYDYESS